MILIIANILSLLGNLLFTSSSIVKNKKKILLLQSSNYVLAIIAEFLTNAYSGLVQEAVSLIRNIIFLFIKINKKIIKLILTLICVIVAIVVGTIINIIFSDNVWYGYLPIAATIVYTFFIVLVFIIKFKETTVELLMKLGMIINSIIWIIYGYFIKLYPVMIFNVLNITLCIISIIFIIRIIKRNKILINMDSNSN